MVLWLPTFLRVERKLAVPGNFLYILIAGSFVGYLGSALLSDLIGRRWNFVLFATGAIATVLACISTADETVIVALAFPLGIFASGTFSGMGAFFTELFPTRMRGSGAGFAYNFGRGFAALILWLVGFGVSLPLGLLTIPSLGLFVVITYGLVIIAALLLPETNGRVLDTAADEAQETVPGVLQART
jgi:MFS family permease